jgi:signal transduction histidine kinase
MSSDRSHSTGSWIFLGVLGSLALALGILQYRWIGEISRAERQRLKSTLEASLSRVSRDFNAEVSSVCSRLTPATDGRTPSETEYVAQYERWRRAASHLAMVQTIAVASPAGDSLQLKILDPRRLAFTASEWPRQWLPLRQHLLARLTAGRGEPLLPPDDPGTLIDIPIFGRGANGPFARRESQWLLLELDKDYLANSLVPELLRRDLGETALEEYDFEVFARSNLDNAIYASAPDRGFEVSAADASAPIFDSQVRPRRGGPRFELGPPPGPPPRRAGAEGRPAPPGDNGFRSRWVIAARHRAGSLESAVARTRTRNLAVSSALLLLILAAGGALVRFTRGAQKLAELQMQFVAGVSHELCTPLSVMRTAGHNLQTMVASDPARVHKYGALIQRESEKLTAVVEQILQFSNVKAGRVIGARAPVSIESVIEDALAADRQIIEESGCVVVKNIDPRLEPVLADRATLTHAVQNLLSNAAKYGKTGGWIGISASMLRHGRRQIEVRIADRGEGIASDEVQQIFQPFYRGRKARADQIHGTGLGLSLVKRIIEAHEGAIEVETAEAKGTAFIIRLPVASGDVAHECEDSAG